MRVTSERSEEDRSRMRGSEWDRGNYFNKIRQEGLKRINDNKGRANRPDAIR